MLNNRNILKSFIDKPESRIEFGNVSFYIGIFLLASAPFISSIFLIISLIFGSTKRKENYLSDIWNYPFIVSGILMIISSFLVANLIQKNSTQDLISSIIGLFNWLPFFWIFWSSQIYLKSIQQRKRCIFLLITGSIPILLTGLGQYYLKWYGPFETLNGLIIWFQRPLNTDMGLSGLFSNQNYAASWLIIIFPFTLAFIIKKQKDQILNIFSYLIFILFSLTIILTTSRNAFLGMVISLIFFFKVRRTSLLIFILFIFIISIINHEIIYNQLITLDYGNLISEDRLMIWSKALNLISERKLFGWGSSAFPVISKFREGIAIAQHSHNLQLDIALNYGIPVSIIINSTIVTLIYKSLFTLKKLRLNFPENNFLIYEKAWIVSSMLFIIFHLFDLTYFDIRINLIFWILLAGIRNIIKEKYLLYKKN